MDNITFEQVNEFYEFLQGELPKEIRMTNKPKLSKRKAFSIVWYLQEHLRIFPDNFEQCCRCGILYDNRECGFRKRDRCYCGSC